MIVVIAHNDISLRGAFEDIHIFQQNAVASARRIGHALPEILHVRFAYVQMDAVFLAVFETDILEADVGDVTSGAMVHAESAPRQNIAGTATAAVYAYTVAVCHIRYVFIGFGAYDERVAAQIVPSDAVFKEHILDRALEGPLVGFDAEYIIVGIAEATDDFHILAAEYIQSIVFASCVMLRIFDSDNLVVGYVYIVGFRDEGAPVDVVEKNDSVDDEVVGTLELYASGIDVTGIDDAIALYRNAGRIRRPKNGF